MADVYVDIDKSMNAFGRQHAEGAMKVWEDLERYRHVIAASCPEVVVETGTFRGGSARWFARLGLDVITIDIAPTDEAIGDDAHITWIVGDSADPQVAEGVADLVRDRRTMVVLDSSHHAYHVQREIALYGPLVTPECYLVVEDGIVRWTPELPAGRAPGPLDAVELSLVGNADWERDIDVEGLYLVSMHPMGWWRCA